MAVIGSKVFTVGGTDSFLTLANEEYIHSFSVPWTRVRVGVMCAINPDPVANTNNLANAVFAVGVGSGGLGFTTETVPNWYGYVNLGTFTYNANAAGNYYNTSGFNAQKRVSATVTNIANPAGLSANYPITPTRKTFFYFEFDKTLTSAPFCYIDYLDGSGILDWSYSMFMDALMQTTLTPTINNIASRTTSYGGATALSETAGPLNCVTVYWNKFMSPMEIYAIALYRFS